MPQMVSSLRLVLTLSLVIDTRAQPATTPVQWTADVDLPQCQPQLPGMTSCPAIGALAVVYNNLGGYGPDYGQGGPEGGVRLTNFAVHPTTCRTIDLLITNFTEYRPWLPRVP